MIHFSPAKINIGLQILEKREDGFHNIRSVMYPIGLSDILEIRKLPEGNPPLQFSQSGILIDSGQESNLVYRAWELLAGATALPPLAIHLHKQIPVGAGLGGGSSNASLTLKALNQMASNNLAPKRLESLAARLGSDCPFFLHKGPMLMEGRGEILSEAKLSLDGSFLVVLFPGIHVSTAEAYAGVVPKNREDPLESLILKPAEHWKGHVKNDFEETVFALHPLIRELKNELYHAGAQYASLSGSGSSIYGIFRELPHLPSTIKEYVIWEGAF
jgi:4-diphosphocytidyl-2-C-methyl-D-erythritol kinase